MEVHPRKILTVTQLTVLIKSQLEKEFSDVWMEGEISNFRAPHSGHLYFTLKDSSAQVRAVFFRSAARSLRFVPKDGMHVIGRGRVTVYEPRGEYQIVLDYMEPEGIGALQLAFEQLKEKLWKEGLFDENRKKPLPMFPRKIGVVTSPTGAALRDILNVCRRRFANVDILIAPAAVQGERAVPEIVEGITDLNDRKDIDVIIVARGGGGIEDLWAFNEEAVARAISHSIIPVISAVGHEIDYTIADFVADLRAPTPSAAAEQVVQNKEDLQKHLAHLTQRLRQAISSRLDLLRTRVASLYRILPHPREELQRRYQRHDDLDFRLRQGMVRFLRDSRGRVENILKHLLVCTPANQVENRKQRLMTAQRSLGRAVRHGFQLRKAGLERIFSSLHTLNPLAVLGRGYSISLKLPSLEVIHAAREVKPGDRIRIKLQEGELQCVVEKIG